MVKELLQLGDPRLYTVSSEVTKEELPQLQSVIQDLRDTVMDNRRSYGFGKALAAPQIGVFKRLIYFRTEQTVGELISQAFGLAEDALAKHHILFINPVISYPDEETMSDVYKRQFLSSCGVE